MLNVNDTVEFAEPMADEVGVTFTIVEMNGDRCVIEANVDMPIKPQTVAMVADLKAAQ